MELLTDFSNNLLMDARSNVLAGVGFIFLGSTFIKMFSLIEESFNEIWHIKKSRSLIRKISDYISFFIFLPLLFITLNGISLFFLSKIKDIGFLYYLIKNILPLFSMTIFFYSTFLSYAKYNSKSLSCTCSFHYSFCCFFNISIYLFPITIFVNRLQYSIWRIFCNIYLYYWIRISWFIIILGVHICYLIQNANFDIT